MALLALIIALVALGLASAAYVRTGGLSQLHEQSDEMRSRTADLLDRFERAVRPPPEDEAAEDDLEQARRSAPPAPPRASA